MASIVSALAKAAGKTAAAPFKEAKEAVSKQFDPSKSIYGLGLGVGPLLRQTTAEYKRQRTADKQRVDEAKEASIDRKAMAKASQSSANALGNIGRQLNSISITMREIRAINQTQLRIMQGGPRGNRVIARPSAGVSASTITAYKGDEGGGIKQGGSDLFGSMGGLLDMLGTAGKIGLAGIAGSLIWANRSKIKETVDEFLSGAGLPTSDVLYQDLKKSIKDGVVELGTAIGGEIKRSIEETVKDLGPAIRRKLGLPEPGKGSAKPGEGVAGTDLSWSDLATKEMGGSVAGAWAGSRVPGPWWLKAAASAAGGYYGADNPELAMEAAGVVGSVQLVNWMRKAAAAKQAAAAMGPEAAATAAAAKPGPAGTSTLTPEELSRANQAQRAAAARQTQLEREVADAIAKQQGKQISNFDQLKRVATDTADELATIADNPAIKNVLKWAGKSAAALGVAVTINQAYDDIKDGDFGAASVRLSGLLASLGLATFGSVLFTPVVGVSSSLTVGVGSGVLADKLKSGKRADIADSMPQYNEAGDVIGFGYTNTTTAASTTMPVSASRPSSSQADIRRIDNATMPQPTTTSAPAPSATQTAAAGSYKIPVNGPVTGGFGEPRARHAHKGIDIAAKAGDPVKAIADGSVFFAGDAGDYGLMVHLYHDDKRQSKYAHLGEIYVKLGKMTGERVKAGQVIGAVGNTGISTGSHLHLEILDSNGVHLNPRSLIPGLPEYSGRPVAGVEGASSYDGVGPPTLAGLSGASSSTSGTSTSTTRSMFSNPFSAEASAEHLKRMGFSESEIPELLEAQKSMRDLMNIGDDIKAMFLGGGGTDSSAGSQSQSVGGNAVAPTAANFDPEKDRLMRLAGPAMLGQPGY